MANAKVTTLAASVLVAGGAYALLDLAGATAPERAGREVDVAESFDEARPPSLAPAPLSARPEVDLEVTGQTGRPACAASHGPTVTGSHSSERPKTMASPIAASEPTE